MLYDFPTTICSQLKAANIDTLLNYRNRLSGSHFVSNHAQHLPSGPFWRTHEWNANAQEDQLLYGKTGQNHVVNSQILTVTSTCVCQVLSNRNPDVVLSEVIPATSKQRLVTQVKTWAQSYWPEAPAEDETCAQCQFTYLLNWLWLTFSTFCSQRPKKGKKAEIRTNGSRPAKRVCFFCLKYFVAVFMEKSAFMCKNTTCAASV